LHVSTQKPALGELVTIRLRVPVEHRPLAAVRVRENPDHEPRWTDATHIGTVAGWHWWQADIHVTTLRHTYRWLLIHDRGDDSSVGGKAARVEWLSQSGLHAVETLDSEDFALLATTGAPDWLHESVIYQVFPDRFARSRAADDRATPEWALETRWDDPVDPVLPARSQQFYGGDLEGIREHLDHIQSLGATMIYLTPIFPARSNHRYDASSFDDIDELLGGREALIHLVDDAHSRGLTVIGDLTLNHCGDDHEWFRRALGSQEAPEGDFFFFTNDDHTEYVSWLNTPSLPKFNWNSAQLRRRFFDGKDSVVARWLSAPYNLDGWRVDVANMTGRLGAEDLNAEVRQLMWDAIQEVGPDKVLLAEVANDATSDLQGDAWHGAMTYPPFTRPVWGWLTEPGDTTHPAADGSFDPEAWFFGQPFGGIPTYSARDVAEMTVRFSAGIPWRVRLGNMNALDTHDTARFRTHTPAENVPLAVALSVTLPGVPVIFAGDEFALTGHDGEMSRTPMPWGSEPEVTETLELYRTLIGVRRQLPALSHGAMRWVHVADDALAFVRETAETTVLVVAARSPFTVSLPRAVLATTAISTTALNADEPAFIVGSASVTVTENSVELTASDHTCAIWVLPGVDVPEA
jgi:alpha-glucosidase